MHGFAKMTKRFLIGGSPGSGKSTLLYGRGDGDPPKVHYPCLRDLGYVVFGDVIGNVLTAMVREGKNPLEHGEESLKITMKEEVEHFLSVKQGIAFFDKGLPYYEGVARKMGIDVPEGFYSCCKRFRYDNPVIILDFISNYDLTLPRNSESRTRAFTVEEREEMDKWFENSYRKQGYDVIRIPLLGQTREESIRLRLETILEVLGL